MGSVGVTGSQLSNLNASLQYANADAYDILDLVPVNKTNSSKVQEIADDIRENGWNGLPILYSENYGMLITGSHRQKALKQLDNEGFDVSSLGNVAVNVDDEIEVWAERTGSTIDELPYDNLGKVFKGTWLEKYKNYIEEW